MAYVQLPGGEHCGKANWTAASEFSSATRRSLPCCLAGHPMAQQIVFYGFSPGQKAKLYTVSTDGRNAARNDTRRPQGRMGPYLVARRNTELFSVALQLIATPRSGSSTLRLIKFRPCRLKRPLLAPLVARWTLCRRHAFRFPQPYAFRFCCPKVGGDREDNHWDSPIGRKPETMFTSCMRRTSRP